MFESRIELDLKFWLQYQKSNTDQVQHSVGVSCEFGNLGERWVFPHQDLVLRVSMSAYLWNNWFNQNTFIAMMLSCWQTDTACLASKFILHCLLTGTLTNSLACLDQARLQTWDPVSMHCSGCEVKVFQNRIQRSAVPPPEASRPCWWGDQAMALTAARWSMYVCTGVSDEWFHTSSWNNSRLCQKKHVTFWHWESVTYNGDRNFTVLSLPPEASSWWSVLHFRPHTSCLCPCSRLSDWSGGVRTSLWRIIRSRLPDDSWSAFHANAPATE